MARYRPLLAGLDPLAIWGRTLQRQKRLPTLLGRSATGHLRLQSDEIQLFS